VDALVEHRAGGGYEILVALDALERGVKADVAEPLVGMLGGQGAALGERG
jgi:hypothetical protein